MDVSVLYGVRNPPHGLLKLMHIQYYIRLQSRLIQTKETVMVPSEMVNDTIVFR